MFKKLRMTCLPEKPGLIAGALLWLCGLYFFLPAAPLRAQPAPAQSQPGFFQKMMAAGKKQQIYRSLDSTHRRVEAARVWDAGETVLNNFPAKPKFEARNAFYILKAALLKQTGRYGKLKQALAKLEFDSEVKHPELLHRYQLLPATFLGPEKIAEYLRSDSTGRIKLLQSKSTETVYRNYLLGRLYWKTGRLEAALEPLEAVRERTRVGEIPWLEASLYRVSSLFKLERYAAAKELLQATINTYEKHVSSQAESEQRFVEVEGQWTVGTPLEQYLEAWQKAIEAEHNDHWYETVGRISTDIPYFRFFNSHYPNEPLARFMAALFKQAGGVDFAAANHKGLRAGLRQGPVERHELRLILPWDNAVRSVVLRKPGVVGDTVAEGSEQPLNELLRKSFERIKFSLGLGDPLGFSAGIRYGRGMSMEPRFPTGFGDTVVFAASSYVVDNLDEFALGVLKKETRSTLERTDRELLEDYLGRSAAKPPEVVVRTREKLPRVSFLGLDSDQVSPDFGLIREQIAVIIQSLVMFLISLGILISLVLNWRAAKKYTRTGLYLGLGYCLVALAMFPLVQLGDDFMASFPFGRWLFYLFALLGLAFAFIKIVIAYSMGSFYSESLGVEGAPLLHGDIADCFEWKRALWWTLGLTGVAFVYTVGLFLLTDPSYSKPLRQMQRFSFINFRRQPVVVVLVNLVLISFMEELGYRFGVQNFLAHALKLGKEKYWLAIWITATLWTLAHLTQLDPTWVKFIQILPFGVALGYLYRRYGLEMCVLCHGLFNVSVIYLEPYLIESVA